MAMSGPSWNYLPTELRLLVLDELILAARQDESTFSLAPYSAVCSEWQAAIEPTIFRSLRLTPARLETPGFVDMVNRGRGLGLVRQIDLCIPFREYDCPDCEVFPTVEENQDMISTIEDGLHAAFTLLSTWQRTGDLSLDITVQSPSDSSHYFQHIDVDNCDRQATAGAIHDPRHGWNNGKRVSLPPKDAIDRLFSDIEVFPEFGDTLPQVTAVTSLCLRRQTTRRWEPGAIRDLVEHLIGLQELHYEPWREWDTGNTARTDASTQELVESLPVSAGELSKVVLFEDFSEAYIHQYAHSVFGTPAWLMAEPVRTPSRAVATELALAGSKLQRLEQLSVAFLVDATHFLPAVLSSPASEGTGGWSRLASLTLTSRLLDPTSSTDEVNELLETAAAVAARLPALRLIELWNGGKGLACVFRYQGPSRPASSSCPLNHQHQVSSAHITWRATWRIDLEVRVVRAWERVARKHQPCGALHVVRQVLGASTRADIQSHGDAIGHLNFSHDVLQPVSLSQIQKENRY